jgi:hypothetical protein
MSITYYTVVYRVDGDKSFHDGWWQSVRPLFLADDAPVSITSISKADEMTRLDRLREIMDLDMNPYDKMDAIREKLTSVEP